MSGEVVVQPRGPVRDVTKFPRPKPIALPAEANSGEDVHLMLTGLALGLVAVLALLDIVRRQMLGRLSMSMETILAGPILANVIGSAPSGEGGNVQPLRNLLVLRLPADRDRLDLDRTLHPEGTGVRRAVKLAVVVIAAGRGVDREVDRSGGGGAGEE